MFTMVGEAGVLNPKLRIGDILTNTPTWDLREEEISHHYVPPNVVSKLDARFAKALYDEVRKIKGRKKVRILRGVIWSTDAIFRETEDKVVEYSRLGILGVDMESTALMTVALYRRVRFLTVITAIPDGLVRQSMKNQALIQRN